MVAEFQEVETLMDCKTFVELEEEHDYLIFYADGHKETVVKGVIDENFQDHPQINYYLFDGWAIALWDYI